MFNGGVADPAQPTPSTFYEAVGGAETFRTIVARFYQLVREDEVLRPLYPEDEFDAAEDRLRMFLEQYWGGPTTYSELRGHPRLRMRHSPYTIDTDAHDRWLSHMRAAVEARTMDPRDEEELWGYLTSAAFAMINVPFA